MNPVFVLLIVSWNIHTIASRQWQITNNLMRDSGLEWNSPLSEGVISEILSVVLNHIDCIHSCGDFPDHYFCFAVADDERRNSFPFLIIIISRFRVRFIRIVDFMMNLVCSCSDDESSIHSLYSWRRYTLDGDQTRVIHDIILQLHSGSLKNNNNICRT